MVRGRCCGRRGGAGGWLGKRGVGQDHADSACNPSVKGRRFPSNNKTLREDGEFFTSGESKNGLRFF